MPQKLIIKICGIKSPENREAVSQIGVDLLGFIFYNKSKRFVGDLPEETIKKLFVTNTPGVGVFVNKNIDIVIDLANKYNLKYIQLHGNETPEFCKQVKDSGFRIIKAFGINENFNFESTANYSYMVDYFLFDTKAISYGGTGRKFNWNLLNEYKGETPFLLSGGIKPEDADSIKTIKHQKLAGVDLNSGFEKKPGLKNILLIEKFIKKLKS